MEKNKILLIFILVLLLVLVGVSVGLAIYVVRNFGKLNSGEATPTPDIPQINITELTNEHIQKYEIVEPLNTNLLMESDGINRTIRFSIAIGINKTDPVAADEFIATLPSEEVVIKDIAITVIRNKTYQDMMRAGADDIVKEEILARLQETYNNNLIVAVYISGVYIPR